MARWKCDMNCFECKFPDCRNGKTDRYTLRAEKAMLQRAAGIPGPVTEEESPRVPSSEKTKRDSEKRYARIKRYGAACERIRERRKDSGLTRTECAERVGCSYTKFGEWELGAMIPDLDKLDTIFPGIKEELQPLFDKIKEEEKS